MVVQSTFNVSRYWATDPNGRVRDRTFVVSDISRVLV